MKISILDNKLLTAVYSKPANSHFYLQSISCHSPKSIAGVQKDVALRIRRIYSSESEFLEKSKEYMAYLVNRGHVPEKIKSSFIEMGKITRSKGRWKKVLTVNKKNYFLSRVQSNKIQRYEHILHNFEILADLFPQNSFVITNKRAKNVH